MSLPWFKIQIAEFLKETRRMNLWARGAYITIIADYYDNGPPTNGDIAIITSEEVSMKMFGDLFELRDGHWHHARLDKDIAARDAHAALAAANGQHGGRKRQPSNPHNIVDELASDLMKEVATLTRNPAEELAPRKPAAPTTETLYVGAPPAAEVPDPEEDDDAETGADQFEQIPDDFELDGAEVIRCQRAGASTQEIAEWFDNWKTGHIQRGTLASDWLKAWQVRFANQMSAKPPRAKPRIEVSRKA